MYVSRVTFFGASGIRNRSQLRLNFFQLLLRLQRDVSDLVGKLICSIRKLIVLTQGYTLLLMDW